MPTPKGEAAAGYAAFKAKQATAVATFGDTTQPSQPVEMVTPDVADPAAATDSLAARLQVITRIITGGGSDTYAAPGLSAPTVKNSIPRPTGTTTAGSTAVHTYAPAEGNKATYQSYAQSKLKEFGWDEKEMPYLVDLWNRESGWNPAAQNPHSTAYGIAQFLDTTWANYGKKTADPYGQIDAGLKYVAARYGSPSKAIAFWNQHNWY